MLYNQKNKKQRPNGLAELVDYIKAEIKRRKAEKLVLFAGIIILLGIVVVLVNVIGNKNSKTSRTEPSEIITVQDPTDESSLQEGDWNLLEENAYPEINELVNTYFTALKERDADTINKIVVAEEEATVEKLQISEKYVEDYRNIVVYTKKGLLDDTYIAFLYYDVKFFDIDTLAPALGKKYVVRDEQGDVYMYSGALDGEVQSYIQEMMKADDVVALSEDVDKRYQQAIESDQLLADFLQTMYEEYSISEASADNEKPTETEEITQTTETAETTEVPTTASNES